MTRFPTFPASRTLKWLVFGAWLALLVICGPLIPKFDQNQSNEQSSFLPGGTESLEALELSRQFPSGENVPAVIVYRRESGLTQADRAVIDADAAEIGADLPPVASTPLPVNEAPDGRAALLTIPMEVGGDSDALVDAIDSFRERIDDPPPGLQVKIGGPGGFSADAVKVFENINGILFAATAGLVVLLLLLIYRSPIFWLIPFIAVLAAEGLVQGLGYLLIEAGVTINGQSAGILRVLVFGAGTDYALLLVARYREELHHHEDRHHAMRVALAKAGPAIAASAGTVIAGLLCLTLAQVNGTQGLGAIGAIGVAIAALSMLTLLPALLVIVGRWAFWPFIPRYDGTGDTSATRGWFRRLGEAIARRPRPTWIGVTIVLGVLCLGLTMLNDGLTSANGFRGDVEAVQAQELISASFPGGTNAPTDVIVRDATQVESVRAALTDAPGVSGLGPIETGPPGARFDVILEPEPFTPGAYDLIPDLRRTVDATAGVDGAVLIGGATAVERDFRVAATRDTLLLPPIVLVVVLLILILLLRSVAAPLLLIATVILSFLSALGVSVVVFDLVFGFPGVDPSFPLFAFIFLVALGVDYNIFLMARAREEALRHGTREGMLRALAATGAVITSAGIVLAGTFAVLGVLPLVALTEIGFVVAFGVLLDTLIVRSILVPALVIDLDRRTWWPSALGAGEPPQSDGRARYPKGE